MPVSAVFVVDEAFWEEFFLLCEVCVELDAIIERVDDFEAWNIGERILDSVIIQALDGHALIRQTRELLMDLSLFIIGTL